MVVTARLGLPPAIRGCLFDVDGVLTRTEILHAAAWKQTFDTFLRARAERGGPPFSPFDLRWDYAEHVDGRHREDGARAFLASRGLILAEGDHDDPPELDTVWGIANRKNELVLELMHRRGVERYDGSVRYVTAVRDAGLACAAVSASENCADVLAAAGIAGLFDVRVDGLVALRERLRGKPAPDAYLAAARRLGLDPSEAAVFEDALAGVAAGRAGGFGYVVGVDRSRRAEALRARGADVVVADLGELLDAPSPAFPARGPVQGSLET